MAREEDVIVLDRLASRIERAVKASKVEAGIVLWYATKDSCGRVVGHSIHVGKLSSTAARRRYFGLLKQKEK